MSRLSARRVSKTYGSVRVLENIDFEIAAGDIRALVGENGAGKSTLIKIVSGAVVPSTGVIMVDGRDLPLGIPHRVRRLGVSVVYQEFTLVPDLSVTDNLFLGREIGHGILNNRRMRREAARILEDLHVDVAPSALVRDLNVAHQQLVEIARALLDDAKVLILDEPTATLTAVEIGQLFKVVRTLSARGVSVIYVSHRLVEIFALAKSITVLRDGRHIGTRPVEEFDRANLIRMMVGRDLADEFPPRSTAIGQVVLDVARLTSPGRFHDVTFAVHEGEIVGLAGLVGAGRTSVGLALAGALPARGEIAVRGRRVRLRSPSQALAHGIAYVTEDRKRFGVFEALGVDENIAMSHLERFCRAGWLTPDWRRPVAAVARRVDVRAANLSQRVSTLSGGNQQKALLARSLLKPPAVLVLDEPTRGVDVGARAEIYRLVNDLAGSGLGILMISSDLEELLGMCDRVLVMREGRVTGELARSEATPERVMALATDAA